VWLFRSCFFLIVKYTNVVMVITNCMLGSVLAGI